jgi:putative DNA-invertase from lambdoid prophage Rac
MFLDHLPMVDSPVAKVGLAYMNVAIYARVSTTDQDCCMQIKELREYCKRRRWTITTEYVDHGWSGSKASRPQLDLLMNAARLRKFDAVVVWKLDRWGRSVAHLVNSVQELACLGVRFLAVTQNIDTDESNPMSRLLLHMMAAFAEFERELIRERVKAGLERVKADGQELGRPRVVFDKEKVRKLRQQGKSIRHIATTLKLSHGVVQRAAAMKRA